METKTSTTTIPIKEEKVEILVKKRKPDEMGRIFSIDDEISILKAWSSLREQGIESYDDLYKQVKTIVSPVDRDQVKSKVQKLKRKYIQAELKLRNSGKNAFFPDVKSREVYQLSRSIWSNDGPSASVCSDGVDAKVHVYIEKLKGMGIYDFVKGKCLESLSVHELLVELAVFSKKLEEARDVTLKMIGSLE